MQFICLGNQSLSEHMAGQGLPNKALMLTAPTARQHSARSLGGRDVARWRAPSD